MDNDKSMEVDYVVVNGRKECHPLHNILILENIFKFLRLKDLKHARGVCTQWNDIASPYAQEKAVVRLAGERSSPRFLLLHRTRQQFLHQFRHVPPKEIFFRNYELDRFIINGRCQEEIDFWEKFGGTMNSVKLCAPIFQGIAVLRNVLFYWTPQLKRLHLKDCWFSDVAFKTFLKKTAKTKVDIPVNRNMTSFGFFGTEGFQLPLTWKEVFIGFPLLKQLKLCSINESEVTKVLVAIWKRIQTVPGNLLIEKLNISNRDFDRQEITAKHLELLSKLNIPLKNLNMNDSDGDFISPIQFANFLEVYAKNLKKLKIRRNRNSEVPMDDLLLFPFGISFANLTVFKATNNVTDNLHFLECMPKLRELHLLDDNNFPVICTDIVGNTTDKGELGPFPNLKYFNTDYSLPDEEIKKLCDWFPNITKLRMHLYDISFPTVCKQWKKLIELEVLGSGVTDNGILGHVTYRVDFKGKKHGTATSNHLLNLTELRIFKMNNDGKSTIITDESIILGFAKLKNLTHFELCSKYILKAWSTLSANEKIKTLIPTDGNSESNLHLKRYTK